MFQRKCIVCEKYHATSEFGEESDARAGYGLICRECLIDRSIVDYSRGWQLSPGDKDTPDSVPKKIVAPSLDEIDSLVHTTDYSQQGEHSKIRIEELDIPPELKDRILGLGIRRVGGLKLHELNKKFKILDTDFSEGQILEIKRAIVKIAGGKIVPIDIVSNPSENILIHDKLGRRTRQPSDGFTDEQLRDIFRFTADTHRIPLDKLLSHSRKKEYGLPRDTAVFVLREYFHVSFPRIGRIINRDHTTIIHSFKSISKRLIKYPETTHSMVDRILHYAESKLRGPEHLAEEYTVGQLPLVDEETEVDDQLSRKNIELLSAHKIISERNYSMYLEYKKGATLNKIARGHKITRSRADQIVLSVIKTLAARDLLSRESAPSVERAIEIEKILHEAARDAQNRPIDATTSQSRPVSWSRGYDACVECGMTTSKHYRKGLCEVCGNKSIYGEEREKILQEHGEKCDVCGITRYEAREKYKRDFYISRKLNKVFCRKCFSKYTGTQLGHRTRTKRIIKSYTSTESYVANNKTEIWSCRSRKSKAQGLYDGKEFVVLAGSVIDSGIRKSFEKHPRMVASRNDLLRVNGKKVSDKLYELKNDVRFKSPSAASTFCQGGASDGWISWRNKDGATLDEVFRRGIGIQVNKRKNKKK